jgi:hypothetical protein
VRDVISFGGGLYAIEEIVAPEGDHPHRYLFTVFAVKTDKLDVKADTSAAVIGFNLHFNTSAKAEIMGLFKR